MDNQTKNIVLLIKFRVTWNNKPSCSTQIQIDHVH
jgi:hypothetical protein